MSDEPLCPMTHKDDEQKQATHGLMLCRGCLRQLRKDVNSHPKLHAELERVMAERHGSSSGRVSGSTDPQIQLDQRIVKARDNIVHDLHSWTRIVMEERGLQGPASDDVPTVAAWLRVHTEWLAAQPYATEVARGFRDTSSEAWKLAYPSGQRHIDVGPCIEPGCSGTLSALVARTDDLLPSEIVCRENEEHVWQARDWLKLGRRVHGEIAERQAS